jgi:hypothetical protein
MRQRAAWGLAVLSAVLLAFGLTLDALNGSADLSGEAELAALGVAFPAAVLVYALIGALVVSKRPDSPIGWILCAAPLTLAASVVGEQYATYALLVEPGSLPGGRAAIWAAGWIPAAGGLAVLTFFLLLFPDGRLPSRRWRPIAWLSAAGLSGSVVGVALAPGQLADYRRVENPFGLGGTAGKMIELVGAVGWLLVLVAVTACATALVVRFRRARGVERIQIKWVAAAAAVAAVSYIFAAIFWENEAVAVPLGTTGILVIPVAAGIAILRYRLYDIDVVINRTLVYGSVTALLAGSYLGLVLLLQVAFSPLTEENSLAVALSTLAVAALFRPVRNRIQALVDRRFYRQKYDAQRTLEGFTSRLREEVDLDALSGELTGVVAETMQPAHVSLWLREAGR